MSQLSPFVDALIGVFEEQKSTQTSGTPFSVSSTVSMLAVLYEKARNAVEFRADHLVRRAAIERILKRRILINGGSQTIAEGLLIELLWAKYIDSSLVDDAKAAEIQQIIDRYLAVKEEVFSRTSQYKHITWDTIMGLASSEIDEAIVSPKKREALINFFYQAIRQKTQLPGMDERRISIQTYIAVERAYAQADDELIMFHLLKLLQPEWTNATTATVRKHIPDFVDTIYLIRTSIRDAFADSLSRYVRRQSPPFLLIRDFFFDVEHAARDYFTKPAELEHKLTEIATRRYSEIRTKVSRAVVRSIIYIFLTKMVFALALEAPFDFYITKRIDYIPLAINTLFPPILLFLVAGLFSVPGVENTRRLVERIKTIFFNFESLSKEHDVFMLKEKRSRPLLTAIFSVFYLGAFLLSFGAINYLLRKLHFNIASQTIFIFFVTLVSFFAYRIRQSAKEYEMVYKQGFLEPLIDFFFLPIIRAGHLLSREIARINIFIVLFDFILEAPLKVIFEVVEEWIRFIRMKKEEIV